MGFLDKAKAMADELAQKADTALASQGLGGAAAGADRYLRDLGVIAYLDATGRPVKEADRERVMAALRDLEQRGQIGALALQTTAPGAVPPPPGSAQTPPAPGPAGQAPPPAQAAPAAEATSPVEQPPTTATPPSAPPPPPSWAKSDDS